MGELAITVDDLDRCSGCGHNHVLIFQTAKEKWWVSCGFASCGKKTKEYTELLDACDEWGLKPSEV